MIELIGIEGKSTRPPPCKLLDWFSHLLSLTCQMQDFLKRTEKPNEGIVIVCSEEEFLMDGKMSLTFSWLEFGANCCSE